MHTFYLQLYQKILNIRDKLKEKIIGILDSTNFFLSKHFFAAVVSRNQSKVFTKFSFYFRAVLGYVVGS
jgi:hypothetical protein